MIETTTEETKTTKACTMVQGHSIVFLHDYGAVSASLHGLLLESPVVDKWGQHGEGFEEVLQQLLQTGWDLQDTDIVHDEFDRQRRTATLTHSETRNTVSLFSRNTEEGEVLAPLDIG
tara:strand:+ start:376 stop:729 length:354 start_codon:yes stop_codon:yes gene_type:complete